LLQAAIFDFVVKMTYFFHIHVIGLLGELFREVKVMKRAELLAALMAAAGVAALSSSADASVRDDAGAYQSALATGSTVSLQEFISAYPDSPYATEAMGQMIELAANQNGKGTSSNNGRGLGGSGPGNQGNDKPVGNAGGYRG
jgi:hypothetical protein